MTAKNLHAKASWRAYRRAADWLRTNQPDVWEQIHREERQRLGLAAQPMFGPRALERRAHAKRSAA